MGGRHWLFSYQTGYAISIYIAACAVVSLVAAALMPDYTGRDISAEYDERRVAQRASVT